MYQELKEADEFLLPQTEEQFDELVKELVNRYHLPNPDHAAIVLSNRIQHIPTDQAYVTLKYLSQSVLKDVAYQVARSRGSKISHKLQIDNIAAFLKVNPHDQQALDALEEASKQGSEYAREILSQYRPVDAGDNVVQIAPLPPIEPAG